MSGQAVSLFGALPPLATGSLWVHPECVLGVPRVGAQEACRLDVKVRQVSRILPERGPSKAICNDGPASQVGYTLEPWSASKSVLVDRPYESYTSW